MTYFRNFSDILYPSQLQSKNSSSDLVRVKNLFRRSKIRDDILNSVIAFTKYKIIGEERPEQVAEKIYGSSTFDWVVLLSNNITNVRTEWPLSDFEFDEYISRKYTSEQLVEPHHYETVSVYDNRGKLIVPSGKLVDSDFTVTYFEPSIQQFNVITVPFSFDSTSQKFDSTLIKFDSEKVVENIQGDTVTVNPVKSVNVYEYEIAQNDNKRNIYVLKPRFLQTIIDDMEEIMSYGFSSQYVDINTKKGGE
jgi:hypothetical protein